MITKYKRMALYGCVMLTIMIGLTVAGLVVRRSPSMIALKLVDPSGRMEVNGVQKTRMEASAYLDKMKLDGLRRVEFIGFEHGTVSQIEDAYCLLSRYGYGGKVTFVLADKKIPAWVYPMEDRHQENLLSENRVIDILVDRDGIRFGGGDGINRFVEYLTNGTPRHIRSELRVRSYDSVIYDSPNKLLAAINLNKVPKNTPIEIMCNYDLSGLLPLKTLDAMFSLGFENVFIAFF